MSETAKIKFMEGPLRFEILPHLKYKAVIEVCRGPKVVERVRMGEEGEVVPVGLKALTLSVDSESFFLKFPTHEDRESFRSSLNTTTTPSNPFNNRTDPTSSEQYFQFYSYLSQQQNMLQDSLRTSTYQRAILHNHTDFQDKVVLDVGAGSGILSFFAVQAGATKVYAVEASDMAEHCQTLVDNNNLADKIIVIAGKIEDIQIEEEVDVVISEPMGYMLFNERMLESFLHAKKWLKKGGMMYPSQGDLHITPFNDENLYNEVFSKANFWFQSSFYGVDLTCLREAAHLEYFSQPVVDTFDQRICMADSQKHVVDFVTCAEAKLHEMTFDLEFILSRTGNIHGLAFWFDVAFNGTRSAVWLFTGPTHPLTHWYQVRCPLLKPLFGREGDVVKGTMVMKCNKRQSYDINIEIYIEGEENEKSKNTLDLKTPVFRYTGQPVGVPPGLNKISPTTAYYEQVDSTIDPRAMDMLATPLNNNNYLDDQQQPLTEAFTSVITNNTAYACVNPGSIPSAPVNLFNNNNNKKLNFNILNNNNNNGENNNGSTIIINNTNNNANMNSTNVLDLNMISLLPFGNNSTTVLGGGVAN